MTTQPEQLSACGFCGFLNCTDVGHNRAHAYRPYYSDEWVTLYHGDCREIAPGLVGDVLITDPPYGVGLGSGDPRGGPHGLAKRGYDSYEDSYENFVTTVVPVLAALIATTKRAAVFTGPHIHEQPKPDAIGGIFYPSGAGRHPWGFKTFFPVLLYGTAPNLHLGAKPNVIRSSVVGEKNGHPCPKPLAWMRWLVRLASIAGESIIDPFAGSGATLRAAKDLGRRAVGVELSERYCEIAARRLSQEVLDFATSGVLEDA